MADAPRSLLEDKPLIPMTGINHFANTAAYAHVVLTLRSPVGLSRMGKQSGITGLAVLSLPILEVVALIAVAGAVGGFRTVALLFLLSVAGVYVFKFRVAQLATRSFNQATDHEGIPRTVGSAMIAVLGGALLILPGFVTAIAGIALQFPPLRVALAHRVTSRFTTTVGTVGTRFGMQGSFGRFGPEGFGAYRGDVIDTDLAADPTDRPPSPSSSPELT